MNDQYGRPVALGDQVTLQGTIVDLTEDPNYANCSVRLTQQMPPSGTETRINLNTQQVTKGQGSSSPKPPQPPYWPTPASVLAAQRQAQQAEILSIRIKLAEVKQMIQEVKAAGGQQQSQQVQQELQQVQQTLEQLLQAVQQQPQQKQ